MKLTRRHFLNAAGVAPLMAKNWERDAFPGWTEEFVDKLLTDSPWAQAVTLPFRYAAPPVRRDFAQLGDALGLPKGWPGPAPAVQTEIYLTVRWASALPMRQAMALHQYGRAGLGSGAAMALLAGNAEEFVVEVAGFPAGMVGQGARRFEAELLVSAGLYVKGRKPVRATAASVPEHGNHLIATLRFPRLGDLSEAEGMMEVSAQAGPLELRRRFKLGDMSYKGRLEL